MMKMTRRNARWRWLLELLLRCLRCETIIFTNLLLSTMSQYMSQDVFVMKYDMLTSQIPAFFLRKKPSWPPAGGPAPPSRGRGPRRRGGAGRPAADSFRSGKSRARSTPVQNRRTNYEVYTFPVILIFRHICKTCVRISANQNEWTSCFWNRGFSWSTAHFHA